MEKKLNLYFLTLRNIQKKTKVLQVQGNKQVKGLHSLNPNEKLKSAEDLFPIDLLNKEVKDKI